MGIVTDKEIICILYLIKNKKDVCVSYLHFAGGGEVFLFKTSNIGFFDGFFVPHHILKASTVS